jgi:outer membrane receptor for ferrienterochelin and colicins
MTIYPYQFLLKINAVIFSTLLSTASLQSYANDNPAMARYQSDYFNQYSPQNLKDILKIIPGTSAILRDIDDSNGESERGFGAGGVKILINSKRISGKSDGISEQLSRIQASSVRYVELIRGTVAGLDVQSDGLIINVILDDAKHSSSTLWDIGLEYISGVDPLPIGSVNHSVNKHKLKYSFAFEHQAEPDHFITSEVTTDTDKRLLETNQRNNKKTWYSNNFSASLAYDLSPKSTIRLNSAYKLFASKSEDPIRRQYFNNLQDNTLLNSTESITEDNRYNEDSQEWELGGDFNYNFEQLGNFKMIFIASHADSTDLANQRDSQNDGDYIPIYALGDYAITEEQAVRSSLDKTITEDHSIEAGFELAFNKLDGKVNFTSFADITMNDKDLITEASQIKENRYQAFFNHNFIMSSTLNLQTSLVWEWSEVDLLTHYSKHLADETSTASHLALKRDFNYVKPRINLRYDHSDNDQFRFNIEKTVSQLDLTDFLPEFNDEENRLEPSNPSLRPEQVWAMTLTYQHNFTNDQGNISLSAFYENITDHLTQIPLENSSALGNVEHAKSYGIKIESNLRLTALGLENTLINSDYVFTESNFTDPFSQLNRQINDSPVHKWSLELQHNAIELGLAYGFSVFSSSVYYYNLYDNTNSYKPEVDAEAFVEYIINPKLKIRLEASELFYGKEKRQRTRYDHGIASNDIAQYAVRQSQYPRLFSLTLRGQF